MAEWKPGRISEISDEKKGENCDADGQCYHAWYSMPETAVSWSKQFNPFFSKHLLISN
ncbi:MAG: hypothetical protein ACLR4Z_09605 [Butyricicoccaceae bacterium]